MTGPGSGRELDAASCPRLADSGVYLLGALTASEAVDYAAHLDGCTACRREVDQLAQLPALLSRVHRGAAPVGAVPAQPGAAPARPIE